MTYGINYQGSKNAIAKEILSFLPDGNRLVDLFGGGGAISHCACLSDKYQKVLYNEKNKFLCDGIRKAITEGFGKEVRWVSREEFYALKNIDFYVASCFSFSGNFKEYLYSKDLEPIKKALFFAKIYNNDSLLKKEGVAYTRDENNKIVISKENSRHKKESKEIENLKRLKNLENLKRLSTLKGLKKIEINNGSYLDYEYKEGDVVYCGPPYEKTSCGIYAGFNFEEFYNWVETRPYQVFFSSYSLEKLKDRFYLVWERKKTVQGNRGVNVECIYSNQPYRQSLLPTQLFLDL